MSMPYRLGVGVLVSVFAVAAAAADPTRVPRLVLRATYDTGFGANGAEIISVRHTDGVAVLTSIAGAVDVLDLSNPLQPTLLHRVLVDTSLGTPNSAALHPHHDYFLVVQGVAGAQGYVAAYRLSDGLLLDVAPVGIQPDSVAISPNGHHAVIANEAEGAGTNQSGGPGSLSVVDLSGFTGIRPGELSVTTIAFPALTGLAGFSTDRTDDLAGLRIDNTPETIEPESVAFTRDSRFAYVTLQENNGVARLDLRTRELTFFGLGQVDHKADLTNDGSYSLSEDLVAFREPDGIALDPTSRFFVTADEGDTRDANQTAGPRGGRTVSVFDAESGLLLGDTGSALDDAASAIGAYPDSRSPRGGTEPEVLDLTHYRGLTLVAVGLERGNAVALIDVSDPTTPRVIDVAPVGVGPEGIKFFRHRSRLFVASANEVSGTLSILEVLF